MIKFGHQPEERMPLPLLVNKIATDLFLVLAGNGYKKVGFALVVQNLEEDETGNVDLCCSGNLRPPGIKALLENVLIQMGHDAEEEKKDESKH